MTDVVQNGVNIVMISRSICSSQMSSDQRKRGRSRGLRLRLVNEVVLLSAPESTCRLTVTRHHA